MLKWFREAADKLPFGLAPFVILVLTLVAGVYLLLHPIRRSTADLRMWLFSPTHYDACKKAVPSFEEEHPGKTVALQLVHATAVTSRLRAAFWSDLDVPDLVEVEITSAGSFFRGPVEDVGFTDLTPFLKKSGLLDRIVKTRLAPYTNRGRIFGLPRDVHPVMLAYRRDLFEEAGIDVARIETWDDFVREAQKIVRRSGPNPRYMIQLNDSGHESVETLLFQRDGGYFDAAGNLTMDSEIAFATLRWLVPVVAGPNRIAANPGSYGQAFYQGLGDGYICSFICPDWRSSSLQLNMPQLAGKMALMPLPAFERGGRRTSTWGGTMLGITQKCPDKELAWKFAEHICFSKEGAAEQFRETNTLPPYKDAWSDPAFREPRAYWSGQRIGELYIEATEDLPAQYGSPFLELAKLKIGEVIAAGTAYYEVKGEEGFDEFLRTRLKQGADDVRRAMTRNPF